MSGIPGHEKNIRKTSFRGIPFYFHSYFAAILALYDDFKSDQMELCVRH